METEHHARLKPSRSRILSSDPTHLTNLPDVSENVFLGDPAGDTRSVNLRDVDVVFFRDLPDKR